MSNKYNLKFPMRGETIIDKKLSIVDIKDFDLTKDEFTIDYKNLVLKSDDFNSFFLPKEVFKDLLIKQNNKKEKQTKEDEKDIENNN